MFTAYLTCDDLVASPESRSWLLKLSPCIQVVDLYWGVDPEEWDSPELQRLRMKLLEECLKTSAGPCFVVSASRHTGLFCIRKCPEWLKTQRRPNVGLKISLWGELSLRGGG